MNNKFSYIHFLLLIFVMCAITSCYDLEDMGHNPYEIEDKTSGAGTEIEDTTKSNNNTRYADLDLTYKLSADDSLTCKTDLAQPRHLCWLCCQQPAQACEEIARLWLC